MKKQHKLPFFTRMANIGKALWKFATVDIWRITENETSGLRHVLINMAKTLIISVRRFLQDNLQRKASALTYSTILALVPILALLFAIGKGFGFQNIIQSQLLDYFPAQQEALEHALGFVDAYLNQAKSGVFVGVGILFLLWTIISLLGNVEGIFNDIWQVKKSRSMYRKITDYISLFLILPVLMIASSGISLFLTSNLSNNPYFAFITPVVMKLLSFSPYVLTWVMFTVLYVLIPNTHVKIKNAIPAGIVSGTAFQVFQFIYLSGQLWVSKYNAIYGSFAFLPLLLLWIQLSWVICLFGATLAFSSQNIRNFNFEHDTKNITRRYKDFLTIVIASVIIRRFVKGEKPLTVNEISNQYFIPIKLTGEIVYELCEVGIIIETTTKDELVSAYLPAMSVDHFTVGCLLKALDTHGSENFDIDNQGVYGSQWRALMKAKEQEYRAGEDILLKDLPVEKDLAAPRTQDRPLLRLLKEAQQLPNPPEDKTY